MLKKISATPIHFRCWIFNMTNRFKLPTPSYLRTAEKLLRSDTLSLRTQRDFNNARRACFNSGDLKQLIQNNGVDEVVPISAGTSTVRAFKGYLDQVTLDLRNNRYYRDYAPTKGNLMARKSLAFWENMKFSLGVSYSEEDFCLTEGSTGAITSVFEALKRLDPQAEVLIVSPTYYIYKLAAEYFGLQYKEVLPFAQKGKLVSFISVDEVIKSIGPTTKMIVVCSPTNPSGEVYSREDIEKLVRVAKAKNIVILVDELFGELIFDPK